MNIKDMLMCPECKCSLSDGLECCDCHHIYSYKYGVYDVISQKLSSNQEKALLELLVVPPNPLLSIFECP